MKRVLVLKTSTDATMSRLFDEICGTQIDCMIQSSEFARYQAKYPDVSFIDIENEGFYDLKPRVLALVADKLYDEIYVTFSGVVGHHYGNVVEILEYLHFSRAYFYNCEGHRVKIPRINSLKDSLCRAYIKLVQLVC